MLLEVDFASAVLCLHECTIFMLVIGRQLHNIKIIFYVVQLAADDQHKILRQFFCHTQEAFCSLQVHVDCTFMQT